MNEIFKQILNGTILALLFVGYIKSNYIFLSVGMFMYMGRVIANLGNYIDVSYEVKLKEIGKPLILFLIVTIVSRIFDLGNFKTSFSTFFTIATLFSIFSILVKEISISIISIFYNNFASIIKIFKKYLFKLNKGIIIGLITEVPIIISFFFFLEIGFNFYATLIFWTFSALFFVLIRGTTFLFYENEDEILMFIKLFALSRIAFFILPLLEITSFIEFYFNIIAFFLYYITLLYVFYPYLFPNQNMRLSIKILQLLNVKKKLKLNQIANELNESKEVIEPIINSLQKRRYINKNNKFFEVKSFISIFK